MATPAGCRENGRSVAAIHTLLDSLASEYEGKIGDLEAKNAKLQQRLDATTALTPKPPAAFSIPGVPCEESPGMKETVAPQKGDEDGYVSEHWSRQVSSNSTGDRGEEEEDRNNVALREAAAGGGLPSPDSASFTSPRAKKKGKRSSGSHMLAAQRAASASSNNVSEPSEADSQSSAKGALAKEVESDLLHLREIIENDKKARLAAEYEERLRDYDLAPRQQMGVRGLLTLSRRVSFAPGDVQQQKLSVWRRRAIKLVGWWMFDAIIGFVIIANAITIGIETSHVVDGQDVPLSVQVMESIFLAVYVLELILRIYAVGLPVFGSHWVKFDTFLVICGVLDTCVKIALAGKSAAVLDKIMLVRMLRLVRLVRAARLVVQFRTLWLLVQGLYLSCLPMFWVFLIMVALIYIFAVLGLELIRDDQFGTLGAAMLTLTQFMFLDGGGPIYVNIMQEKPWLGVYFFGFILLGSVSLMNLVTAIMVESSLRQAKDDQEAQKAWEIMKRKQMEPLLMEIFYALDADGSKELEIDEILAAPQALKDQLLRICNMDDLQEVFEMLDYDDSGAVDIQEFCDGIMRVQADKPAELLRLVKQCSDILKHCKYIYAAIKKEFNLRDSVASFCSRSEMDRCSGIGSLGLTELGASSRPLVELGTSSRSMSNDIA